MTFDTPQKKPRTVPIPAEIRVRVAALVDELGPRKAAERLSLSKSATLAVACGAHCMPGTLALVQEALR